MDFGARYAANTRTHVNLRCKHKQLAWLKKGTESRKAVCNDPVVDLTGGSQNELTKSVFKTKFICRHVHQQHAELMPGTDPLIQKQQSANLTARLYNKGLPGHS